MSDQLFIDDLRSLARQASCKTPTDVTGEFLAEVQGALERAADRLGWRDNEIRALRGEVERVKALSDRADEDGRGVKRVELMLPSVGLCMEGLRAAALRVGPSFSYTLHAHWHDRFLANKLVRAAQVPEHPFGPYINVVLDAAQDPQTGARSWYLVNDETGIGVGASG